VLRGDMEAVPKGHRVLESDRDSDVFLYFIDHGSTGFLQVQEQFLYADQLNETFNYMWEHGLYRKLVFYVEACYSGSLFENILADNQNVYVVTSAAPKEPSWQTYCPPDNKVNGTRVSRQCIGSLFSNYWISLLEKTQGRLTLEEHFQQTRAWVAQTHDHGFKSHVSRYGDLSFVNESLTSFMLENSKPSSEPKVNNRHFKVMNSLDSRLESLILAVEDDP
jgi:legumain